MKTFIKISNTEVMGIVIISPDVAITVAERLPVIVDSHRIECIGIAAASVVPGGVEIEWDGAAAYLGEYNWGGDILRKTAGVAGGPPIVEALNLVEISVDGRYWPPVPVVKADR